MSQGKTRISSALAIIAAALFLLPACAGISLRQSNIQLDLPPVMIEGGPDGGIYDAYELFDRADRAFVAGEWEKAEKIYRRLLKVFPDSEVEPLARYNLGLVLEKMQRWEDALTVYASFPVPPGQGVRPEEVRMRRGICLTKLQRYAEAREEFVLILNQSGVPPLEFSEAQARAGIASHYLHEPIMTAYYLNPALDTYEHNAARGVLYAKAAYAEGYFVMGEEAFDRFVVVELTGDESALASALREKAEWFAQARDYYTLAIRTYEPEWVIASLYKVGLGFEMFYRAILAAPVPEGLTESERQEYRRKLTDKIAPVMQKALQAYRRNLELAADLHVSGTWVELTRAHYEALLKQAQQ